MSTKLVTYEKVSNKNDITQKATMLFVTILFCLLSYNVANGQKISGRVTDNNSQQPLPFVTVSFQGTMSGTITNTEGYYTLEDTIASDTLVFRILGYKEKKLFIDRDSVCVINVELENDNISLDEIIIRPTENPAWQILRNVISNKNRHDPDNLDRIQYETYEKKEICVNNFKRKRSILKHFPFIFNYVDTSKNTDKIYLPVFITESISDIYSNISGNTKKEVVKALLMSGADNISDYSGQIDITTNIYKNYLKIFGQNFTSPVSNLWKGFYKFYLLDSLYDNDGDYLYHLSFKPKRKCELAFRGDIWVVDSIWAVKKVSAVIDKEANLNYISNFYVKQEYQAVDSVWFLNKEELFFDFNISNNTMGVSFHKLTSRKKVKINPVFPDSICTNMHMEKQIVEDDAMNKDSIYWGKHRHMPLSEQEQNIYVMIDSIKDVPVFKTINNTVNMIRSGYWHNGWLEYGPFMRFASKNPIEGWRFRFGCRTNETLSKQYQLNAYVAFGTKDRKMKYGLSGKYYTDKRQKTFIDFSYTSDYEQLGRSNTAFANDNIITTILTRSPDDHLLRINDLKTEYRNEALPGFKFATIVLRRKILPSEIIRFTKGPDKEIDRLVLYEFTHEACFTGATADGSNYQPLFEGRNNLNANVSFSVGAYKTPGSEFKNYYRMAFSVRQMANINFIGQLLYDVEIGQIYCDVPFPILKLHEGNQTYIFDANSFNMMNLYEFASDKYINIKLEHHFNGLFMNWIPIVQKLKLREILYFRTLLGSISQNNANNCAVFDLPETLHELDNPYMELGVGMENILKLFRIDAIWRLSNQNKSSVNRFGLFINAQIRI